MDKKYQKLLSKSQLNKKIKSQVDNLTNIITHVNCNRENNNLSSSKLCNQSTINLLSKPIYQPNYVPDQKCPNYSYNDLNKKQLLFDDSSIPNVESNLINELNTYNNKIINYK